MLVHILWFVLGLVLLIKGGDWFVDGSVGIAKKFKVPDLLIGATVVSIGTTLPEVMVSATSAFQGHGAMAYGNAVGSVICNTALIAALTVAIKPSKVNRKTLFVPVFFFFAAAALYAGNAYITGSFNRPLGFVLLTLFVAYMVILIRNALHPTKDAEVSEEEQEVEEAAEKVHATWLIIVMIIAGAVCIAFGARLLIDHGIAIAEGFGVPETVIALTFVALGTSLPELVTAITSLAKGHGALSLGNICGANLFNIVLVSGLSIAIGPFKLDPSTFSTVTIGGKQVYQSLVLDTPLMLLVMGILTVPAIITGKLKRWQGITLLALYIAFCIYQFV